MAGKAIGFGILLTVLGLGTYFGTGSTHYTALIPAAFGLLLGLLGAVSLKENLRKHALHAASVVALVGFVGAAVMVIRQLPGFLATGRFQHADNTDATIAVVAQLIMAVLCAVFLGLCINTFIAVRRRRQAEAVKSATP